MWIQTITWLVIVGNFGHTQTTDDRTKFPQPYQFGYTVSHRATGDFKSHREVNDGRQVRGRYSLVEPTGDLRVVTYTADRTNGFRANVNVQPRSPPQPTPTYLVKLPPLQKLRRQHEESADVTSSGGQREYNKPAELEGRNDTEPEEIMTVLTDKNVSRGDHQQGKGYDKNTFNTDHLESAGPQIIPVKIEEEVPGTTSEVQKEELNVELTSVNPPSAVELTRNKTTQETDKHQDKNVREPYSQTKVENKDDQKLNHNNNDQSVIKSTDELQSPNSDNQPTQQVPTENSFTTIINLKTSQYQPLHNKNPDLTKTTVTKIKANVNMQEKSNISTNISPISSDNSSLKTEDENQNNMMLAALLLPTTPILKFTCTPDHSDKNMPMFSTVPNAPGASPKSPQSISLGPGGSVFTPSIPLFPFQLVNFSPIKQIFPTPQFNRPAPQKPSLFATRPPFLSAFSTILQNTETKSTAVPQQSTTPDHKNQGTSSKAKPPNGYTNLRTEGPAGQAHKVQSSYYMHHLLPPPWAPHPLHPSHNSHYRHMPIFVLPMSHNYNFAPTFDPDQHNH